MRLSAQTAVTDSASRSPDEDGQIGCRQWQCSGEWFRGSEYL